jgi:phenylpyruvate tautomerase PptA (4-oxalocrotonate tautomerase family)
LDVPHVVVSVLQGMTYEMKRDLADSIAEAVASNVGLPLDMVRREVSFLDVPLENCAPAVGYSEASLPLAVRYVSMNILRGRPLEQKRCIVRDITLAVGEALGVSPDNEEIAVEINEVDPANIAHGGILTVDMEEPPLPLE